MNAIYLEIQSDAHGCSTPHLGKDTSGCGGHCLQEIIRARAYQIFESRHGPPGSALDDWLQAEREIQQHLGF